MTDLTPDQIREYCRVWSVRLEAQRGRAQTPPTPHGLLQASPLASVCEDLEDADHHQLCAILTGLAVAVVRHGNWRGYGRDYRELWAWCAELVVGVGVGAGLGVGDTAPTRVVGRRGLARGFDADLRRMFALTVHAALARPIPFDSPGVGHHAHEVVDERGALLAHLSFPLLERVLRASCSHHFAPDGHVIKAFTAPGHHSRRHMYAHGGTCSSIGDLLWLFTHHYASVEMATNLAMIDKHLVSNVPGAEPGFGILQQWRYQAVRGSTALPVVGAAVLCLTLLVALAALEEDFEEAVTVVAMAAQVGDPAATFYPLED